MGQNKTLEKILGDDSQESKDKGIDFETESQTSTKATPTQCQKIWGIAKRKLNKTIDVFTLASQGKLTKTEADAGNFANLFSRPV